MGLRWCRSASPAGRRPKGLADVGVAAHRQAVLHQVLAGRRGVEVGVPPPPLGQNAPLERGGDPPVRRPPPQPMPHAAIPLLGHPHQESPHLTVAQSQPLTRLNLRPMLLPDLMQHLQLLPLACAQADPFPLASPPMEPDISTLHNPDILTLQRQAPVLD